MRKELQQALETVATRFRSARLSTTLALCWLTWAVAGLALYAAESFAHAALVPMSGLIGALALAAATGIALAGMALRSARDRRWVARRIEVKYPELDTALLSAVEEDAAAPPGRMGFLQTAVLREVLNHRATNDWNQTVSTRALRGSQWAHAATLCCFVAVAVGLLAATRSERRGDSILSSVSGARANEVKVEPGTIDLERGTSLLVVARFAGGVPSTANLVVEDAKATARRHMNRSLEDPTFASRVESVDADLAYRVEFEDQSTETYHVKVFEYPELQRADAQLVFPAYTALGPKTVEDIRHVTAVEGTELTLRCRLNKDVATARLVDAKGQVIELAPEPESQHVYQAKLTLADPARYKVQLVDKEGRANKLASEIVANVTRNRPPVVRVTQPSHDVRVSPVEELKLKATLDDDFGVIRQGMTFTLAGKEPREVILPAAAAAPGAPSKAANHRLAVEHMLDFESLKVVPDQLATYFFWAEDIGPDGKPRRTSGDMFFAEVRPFEEIFRQGEQPAGGSGGGEGGGSGNVVAADQLGDTQKEIINATWKLVRRETGARPTATLAEDAKVILDGQRSALERAGQLRERLRDATSKASLERATTSMKEAEKLLSEVAEKSAIKALNPALATEQGAYQALLALRAREFQVIRNRNRNGGGGGGGASQRQLQQLELADDENRYEQQRSARSQEQLSRQEREERETRQVVSRLRELAQRQADVSERLKELQSALEAASDPQAKAELERQLKRLREQQEQILRDADELRERMESDENRDRMADARGRMEESREHVRRATDALEAGRLSQALTESARAGRQLGELREELRKSASKRFTEQLTQMRDSARKLDEDQKKLTEQLDGLQGTAPKSLRDKGERETTRSLAERQEKELSGLLDRMRQTVQDAEETEPLLAKELFDTERAAMEHKTPDALKATRELTELGMAEDAAKASRHAGEGIEHVRQGVERAAESVLGDETAALKRAQSELEDLTDQINREVAEATGREPSRRGAQSSRNAAGQTRAGARQTKRSGQQPNQPNAREGGRGEQQPQPGEGNQERGQTGERQQGQEADQGQEGQGQQGGQSQEGGQERQEGRGQQGQQGGRGGADGNTRQQAQPGSLPGQRPQSGRQAGSLRGGGGGNRDGGTGNVPFREGSPGRPGGPIAGEGFREWSDRMRDVEELLDNPALHAEAARIRDRVRGEREEFKRHAKPPDWNKLQNLVVEPMNELLNRVGEEVRRRVSPDALVPIDRDPVPDQYAEGVRRYYERLGSGR
jgi:hypothetical protein